MMQFLAFCCLLIGLPSVQGLESNERQINFSFVRGGSVVADHASSILICRGGTEADRKKRPIPFIIVGKPLAGELIMVQPDDDDMLAFSRDKEMVEGLLEYNEMNGSFSVEFYAYSGGYPRSLHMGSELFVKRPRWRIEIDKVDEFQFERDLEQKDSRMEGGEKTEYSCVLQGALHVDGYKPVQISQEAKAIIRKASSVVEARIDASPVHVHKNGRIAFSFTLAVPGSAIGFQHVDKVTVNVEAVGFADLKKGADKLFRENLRKIRAAE